jgi:hypothetical protein
MQIERLITEWPIGEHGKPNATRQSLTQHVE